MDKEQFDLENEHRSDKSSSNDSIERRVNELLLSQDFAVLCTRNDTVPYGSLVAFVVNNDMRNILFATLSYTRKYQLLKQCDQVAMLIDDRDKHNNRISQISALTVNGVAKKIQDSNKIADAKSKLLAKHNYLDELVSSDSCVFFLVDITRCLYVTHLQEVYEWTPD